MQFNKPKASDVLSQYTLKKLNWLQLSDFVQELESENEQLKESIRIIKGNFNVEIQKNLILENKIKESLDKRINER
jgi:hypothetical protein